MIKTYDLTTKEGLENCLDYVKKNPDVLINPLGHFIWTSLNSKEQNKKQVHVALELIEKGKKEGVKKMKIKVSNEAGIDIQSKIEGIPIKVKVGSNGTMEIEVEYK